MRCFSLSLLFLFLDVKLAHSDLLQIQKLRVVKGYLSHTTLQCPIPASKSIPLNQIRWVNEANDYTKPDGSVQLTTSNVLASSQVSFQTFDSLTYLSCGYVSDNCYVRLKLWQLICVGKTSFCEGISCFNCSSILSIAKILRLFASKSSKHQRWSPWRT